MNQKSFQKVIKAIRDDRAAAMGEIRAEFPKAMMTSRQIENNTATVNCGGDWYVNNPEATKQLANQVINDSRFVEFIESAGAYAYIERTSAGVYQIRINYNTNTRVGVATSAPKAEEPKAATEDKQHTTKAEIEYNSAAKELDKLTARLDRQTKRLEKVTATAEKYGVIDWTDADHRAWIETVTTNGGWIVNKEDIKKNGAWWDLGRIRDDIDETTHKIEKARERVAKAESAIR